MSDRERLRCRLRGNWLSPPPERVAVEFSTISKSLSSSSSDDKLQAEAYALSILYKIQMKVTYVACFMFFVQAGIASCLSTFLYFRRCGDALEMLSSPSDDASEEALYFFVSCAECDALKGGKKTHTSTTYLPRVYPAVSKSASTYCGFGEREHPRPHRR